MHLLESVFQHRAISFQQKFLIDVHGVVGVDTEEVGVVGRVVDFAHAQAIGHGRNSMFMGIGDDVRCVE